MFDVVDGKITVNASALNIPEFKALWKRDKSRSKLDAHAELSYIYYMCDYKSEFKNFPRGVKEDKIRAAFTNKRLGEKWKADEKVHAAMDLYKEMQQTASMRFLNSVENTIDKLADYLDDTEPDEETITAILNTIDKGSKLIPGIPKLKETVSKEVSENSKIRGGGETSRFED